MQASLVCGESQRTYHYQIPGGAGRSRSDVGAGRCGGAGPRSYSASSAADADRTINIHSALQTST
eukprot:8831674-Pyramimonas_sp.AAC.1